MNTPRQTSRSRLSTVDTTKGWLVVLMVLYHTFNQSTQYQLGFRYLAFLPPSFILLTGVMLTKVYASRYPAEGNATDARLLLRGLKLILLFSGLNVLLRLVLPAAAADGILRGRGWNEITDVFVVGGGYGVAFDVLLPIAYVLVIAPAILRLNAVHRVAIPACASIAVGAATWLEWQGSSYPNLSLVSVGLVGAWLGRLPVADDVSRQTAVLVAAVGGLLCAVTTARAPEAVLTFPVQSVAAIAAVAALSFGCRAVGATGSVDDSLALLGRYSLASYILQIAILYGLAAVWGRPSPGSVAFLGFLGITLGLTLCAAGLVEWCRPRVAWLDIAYRALFA